jgi:hypothetical protein
VAFRIEQGIIGQEVQLAIRYHEQPRLVDAAQHRLEEFGIEPLAHLGGGRPGANSGQVLVNVAFYALPALRQDEDSRVRAGNTEAEGSGVVEDIFKNRFVGAEAGLKGPKIDRSRPDDCRLQWSRASVDRREILFCGEELVQETLPFLSLHLV